MSTHSIIPPSSAAIWGAPNGCTGWPAMVAQFPEEESEATIEGEASHWLGETLIQMGASMHVTPSVREGLVDSQAPNGVIISDEMFEAAWIYADDVVREIKKYPFAAWGVETLAKAPRIHKENFGTTDAYLYDPQSSRLIVWDYKYGFKEVEAFENWQGIDYAAGLFDMLSIDGLADQTLQVEIRIVQPRAFHRDGPIRSWNVLGSELRGYITQLSNAAHEALSDRAQTRSGEHCIYCNARHACQAALDAGLGMFEAVNKPIPAELTPEQLGTQLSIVKRARKQLEYLESGYEEQLKSLIRGGSNVPGWSVEQGVGKRQWAKPAEEILKFGDLMGVDLREPVKPISPAQAEKKGVDKAVISAYVERRQTGLKVVPDNNNKAREVFSK
jgi:hypothetical protein